MEFFLKEQLQVYMEFSTIKTTVEKTIEFKGCIG